MPRNDLAFTHYTPEDHDRWNAFVAQAPAGHLMQSWEWGDFKAATGWQVRRIGIERDGRIAAGAQILLRPLLGLPLTVAYVPKGPLVDPRDNSTLADLMSAIHRTARGRHAVFLKIEPNWPDDGALREILKGCGFQPSLQTNQPRSTIVVDVSGGEEAVLARMRHETRKLIRRAARDGVTIVEGTHQDLDEFYKMLQSTSEIKDFPIHDKVFYEEAWKAFQRAGSAKLLLARYEGEIVAGKMMVVFGNTSMHLWGGTCSAGRKAHASYLIQWEAMKWAMTRGCKYCDLWGIPDEIAEMLAKGQDIPKEGKGGLWGVYTFKRGFGGQVACYAGAFDFVYSPLLYQLGTTVLMRRFSVDAISSWLEKFSRRPKNGLHSQEDKSQGVEQFGPVTASDRHS